MGRHERTGLRQVEAPFEPDRCQDKLREETKFRSARDYRRRDRHQSFLFKDEAKDLPRAPPPQAIVASFIAADGSAHRSG